MNSLLKKSETGLFARQTLTGHLLRGAVALALLAGAIDQQLGHPGLALLGGVLAMVVMRGCPVRWAIGLVETVMQRVREVTITRS